MTTISYLINMEFQRYLKNGLNYCYIDIYNIYAKRKTVELESY